MIFDAFGISANHISPPKICLIYSFSKTLFYVSRSFSNRLADQVVFIVVDALRADFVFPAPVLSKLGLVSIL
jgi:predicted AlkP superfamily pyrophosphatase or phosphodiesterase